MDLIQLPIRSLSPSPISDCSDCCCPPPSRYDCLSTPNFHRPSPCLSPLPSTFPLSPHSLCRFFPAQSSDACARFLVTPRAPLPCLSTQFQISLSLSFSLSRAFTIAPLRLFFLARSILLWHPDPPPPLLPTQLLIPNSCDRPGSSCGFT